MPISHISPEDTHETASHLWMKGDLLQIQYYTFDDNHNPDTSLKMLKKQFNSDVEVAGSGGTSFMSRSPLGPWIPSFQQRA